MYAPGCMVTNTFNGLVVSNKESCAPNNTAAERRWQYLNTSNEFAGRLQSASAKRHFERLRATDPHLLAFYYYFLVPKDRDISAIDLRRESTNNTDWDGTYARRLVAGASDPEVKFFLEWLLHRSELDWQAGPAAWTVMQWVEGYVTWRRDRHIRQFEGSDSFRMERMLKKYLVWDSLNQTVRPQATRFHHQEKIKEVLLGEKREVNTYLVPASPAPAPPLDESLSSSPQL